MESTKTLTTKTEKPTAPAGKVRKKWPSAAQVYAAERIRVISQLLKMLAGLGDLNKKVKPTCEVMEAIDHAMESTTTFRDAFLDRLNEAELEGMTECDWESHLAHFLAEWVCVNPEVADALGLDRKTRLGMVEKTVLVPRDVWALYLEANKADGRPRNVELDFAHILKTHATQELAKHGKGRPGKPAFDLVLEPPTP